MMQPEDKIQEIAERAERLQEIGRELEKRGFADVTVTAEGRQEEE